MQTVNNLARLAAVVFVLGLVCGCGQKGDLYLPESASIDVSIG